MDVCRVPFSGIAGVLTYARLTAHFSPFLWEMLPLNPGDFTCRCQHSSPTNAGEGGQRFKHHSDTKYLKFFATLAKIGGGSPVQTRFRQ